MMKNLKDFQNDYALERESFKIIMKKVFEETFLTSLREEAIERGISRAVRERKEEFVVKIDTYHSAYIGDYSFVDEIREYYSKYKILKEWFSITWIDKKKAGPVVLRLLEELPIYTEALALIEEVVEESESFKKFCSDFNDRGIKTSVVSERGKLLLKLAV